MAGVSLDLEPSFLSYLDARDEAAPTPGRHRELHFSTGLRYVLCPGRRWEERAFFRCETSRARAEQSNSTVVWHARLCLYWTVSRLDIVPLLTH